MTDKHRYEMAYIDLSRSFIPINKDEEIDIDLGRYWGKQNGGWFDWSDFRVSSKIHTFLLEC